MTIRIVRFAMCVPVAMIVAGVGEAFAQAPDLIYACVRNQGQLRIVDATEACASGERRIQWPTTAPAVGALRVLDANDAFIGWYGDPTTTVPVGNEWISVFLTVDGPHAYQTGPVLYFNSPCPSTSDNTILHEGGGHIGFQTRELAKFALPFPATPSIVYYPGPAVSGFVPLSQEYDESTFTGVRRVCFTFTTPLGIVQHYGPALTFDFGAFTAPFRVSK